MNNFKVGQQVEITTDPSTTPFYEDMLSTMGNPTKVIGTIVYIANTPIMRSILIYSNQLEEHELGHNGNGICSGKFKAPSEKGCWWVQTSQLKPYYEQQTINFDTDKLF